MRVGTAELDEAVVKNNGGFRIEKNNGGFRKYMSHSTENNQEKHLILSMSREA